MATRMIKAYEQFSEVAHMRLPTNKIKDCEECGVPIRVKSSTSKYCQECFKENRKQYIKEKVREYRKNTNVNNRTSV